jgi:inositol oxygenase
MSDNFRNYNQENNVEKTYQKILENQTLEYSLTMKNQFLNSYFKIFSIWEVIQFLEEIIDESDPDNSLPQIVHSYQTAEEIKNIFFENYGENKTELKNILIKDIFSEKEWSNLPDNIKELYSGNLKSFYKITDWSWLPIIGFIHDMGKIMMHPLFGGLPQWGVVGDTFPLGEKLDSNYPFYDKEYHLNNFSLTHRNYYEKNCGFDQVHFSWGHDEYMASFLERNSILFRQEAIYLIRYHSFYSWHSPKNGIRGYQYLANDFDWKMLPLLKLFQKADLYSKDQSDSEIDSILIDVKQKYFPMIKEYFNNGYLFW